MYTVKKTSAANLLNCPWNSPEWECAETMDIAVVRPESSDHHPKVQLRMLYSDKGIFGRFMVNDRYVRSIAEKFQDSVCTDSCVEAFLEPVHGKGYINFEMNCGGTLLAYHIVDATRDENGIKEFRKLTLEDITGLEIKSTLPKINEPELTDPTDWSLAFFIPYTVFEITNGQGMPVSGEVWRGNFYKCGDKTSHPHWISWQPVSKLNFHLPECFGEVRFE